jgi:hypothetical protein
LAISIVNVLRKARSAITPARARVAVIIEEMTRLLEDVRDAVRRQVGVTPTVREKAKVEAEEVAEVADVFRAYGLTSAESKPAAFLIARAIS